jgi:outer membrane biosynthesis protein TonB
VNVKVDKTLVASVALHVLVIGWGLISFSTKAFESTQESLPVDIISSDQLAKMVAGMKSGKKENPKPLVEKVAEAKPVDDAVGKITEKAPVVTDTAPPPQPKPADKPVEKKPEPPKPVAESKPKEEPKPIEKKPDPPKVDPIAEALKKEEKKPPPKPPMQTAKPPEPAKPKAERSFDQSKIAALLDKRDPSRQAVTGETLNSNASLGLAKGNADAIVATWKGAFVRRIRECFTPPYNGQDADQFEADIDIRMRPDGTVAAEPTIVAVRGPSKSVATAVAESAKRAIVQCQVYTFLPKEQYETWKYIQMTFALKED